MRDFSIWQTEEKERLVALQDWYFEVLARGDRIKASKIYKLFDKLKSSAVTTEQRYVGRHGNIVYCPIIEAVLMLEALSSKEKYGLL